MEIFLRSTWLCVCLLCLPLGGTNQAPICNTMKGNCACDTDLGTIDLSPLDSKDPNNPKFKDVADSSGGPDMFSYNPCSAFSEGNSCSNVAVCQAVDSFGGTYPIGDQSSVAWINVDVNGQSVLQLQYTSTGFDGITRTSTITLTCDQGQEGSLIANGETYPGAALYPFELKTKYACAGGGGGGGSGGLSIGSILCILIASLLFVYIIGGAIINKTSKGATGKEVLPNVDFWGALPGLAKDGCLFVFRKFGCCAKGGEGTYESF